MGSDDCHDAKDLSEEVATFVKRSFLLPRDAKRLARETRMYRVHPSGVLGRVEGSHVALVDDESWEPLGGSLAQDSAAVSVPLDCGDGGVSQNEVCK